MKAAMSYLANPLDPQSLLPSSIAIVLSALVFHSHCREEMENHANYLKEVSQNVEGSFDGWFVLGVLGRVLLLLEKKRDIVEELGLHGGQDLVTASSFRVSIDDEAAACRKLLKDSR